MPFSPTFGTPFLPYSPLSQFQTGALLDVPVVIGTVPDEATPFVHEIFTAPLNVFAYAVAMNRLLGTETFAAVSRQYPVGDPFPTDFRAHMASVATDGFFECASRNASAGIALAQQQGRRVSSVNVFRFIHSESFSSLVGGLLPFVSRMCPSRLPRNLN